MKKIIRLTESDLHNIVRASVNRILREDVLGNDWNVSDENGVYNNYEPFNDQERHEQEDEFRDNFDWGAQGEKNIDPTQYDDSDEIYEYDHWYDPDWDRDDVSQRVDDFSDGDLYRGGF